MRFVKFRVDPPFKPPDVAQAGRGEPLPSRRNLLAAGPSEVERGVSLCWRGGSVGGSIEGGDAVPLSEKRKALSPSGRGISCGGDTMVMRKMVLLDSQARAMVRG